MANVQIWLVALELTRANLTECDTRTVVGVDIGGYLKDKSGKLLLLWLHIALFGLGWTWRWGYLYKAVKQLLHTEVVQCRTEEHWCYFGLAICLYVELGIYTVYQLQVFAQLSGVVLAHALIQLVAVDVNFYLVGHALLVGCKQVQLLLVDVIYTFELCSLIDRP